MTVSLVDDQQHAFVSAVNYNPASQITQISAPDYGTAYQYNERNQLVGIGSSTGFGETYAFSPTQNNGQILSQTDTRTGETVSYRYDALGRLANAAATASSVGAAWAMSFGYDGFGNRYSQNMTAGTGPSVNIGFDAGNHINYPAGYSYDGSGNMTSVPGASGPVQYDYDYDNRLKGYTYGIDGKRLVKVTPFESSQPGPKVRLGVYLYLPGGQLQGIYDYGPYRTYSSDGYPRDWAFSVSRKESRVYFAGRWIGGVDRNQLIYRVTEDRLGSVRASATFNSNTGNLQSGFSGYFPYGEQRYGGGANFATYTRDGDTGLDYAQQRQYGSQYGVFTTADPYVASGGAGDPGSWNRYAYVGGDPVNWIDPEGLDYYFSSEPYIDERSGASFSFTVNFSLATQGVYLNPLYNILPADVNAFIGNRDYSFSHRADEVKAPASFSQRVQDLRWLVSAKKQLQTFKPAANSECAKDLRLLDVNSSEIASLAADDRHKGGTDVIDIRSFYIPAVRAQINRNADLTADVENRLIIFNLANFWQTTYSEVLGTLLHELVHVSHYAYKDTDIQRRLGIKLDADDTTNISERLAKDCFSGAKAP